MNIAEMSQEQRAEYIAGLERENNAQVAKVRQQQRAYEDVQFKIRMALMQWELETRMAFYMTFAGVLRGPEQKEERSMTRTREELHAAAYKKMREVLDAGVDPRASEFWVSEEERCVLYDDPNLYKEMTPVDAQQDRICGLQLKVDRTPPHLLKQGYRSGKSSG